MLVGIRPEHVRVGEGPLRGEVVVAELLGAQKLLTVRTAEHVLKVAVGADHRAAPGERVPLGLPAEHLRLMDAQTERALPRD